MSRLTEAQKTSLVLAHPLDRAEPCGARFYIAEHGYKPRKEHATFTTLFPRRVVTISTGVGRGAFAVDHHLIGPWPIFLEARGEVGT